MIIQTCIPARDLTFKCENAMYRKRAPKQVAINQKARCKAPMPVTDSVLAENTQATGAKPISNTALSASRPARNPATSAKRADDPLRHEKMYRLGRQIRPDKTRPAAILSGAAQSCALPVKVPTTNP